MVQDAQLRHGGAVRCLLQRSLGLAHAHVLPTLQVQLRRLVAASEVVHGQRDRVLAGPGMIEYIMVRGRV